MFVEYLRLISALGLSLLLACSSGNSALKEGDKAPDFSLRSAEGTAISLSDFRGKNTVVLYSHPKDQTPGCTEEACNFRDNLQGFKEIGVEILGVSVDDERSHKEFQQKYNLNFTLLADNDKRVSKMYGVLGPTGMSRRVTFVIDREGVIRKIFPDVDVSVHSDEVFEAVKWLVAQQN